MNKFIAKREQTAVGQVPHLEAATEGLKISHTCCLEFCIYGLEAAFGREQGAHTFEVAVAGRCNEEHQNTNRGSAESQTRERNRVMVSRKSLLVATLAVIGAGLLVFTTAGSKEQPAHKLEGAWVVKAPLPPPLPTGQWTMTFAPTEPSGRAAVISGSIQVPVPPALICPATGQASPPAFNFEISRDFVGEAVMTGPRTAKATMIGYSRDDAGQVVFIWVGVGEMTFTGPGKSTATSTLAYYLPESDTNGDGIPEGAPFCVIGPGQNDAVRVGVIPLPGLPH